MDADRREIAQEMTDSSESVKEEECCEEIVAPQAGAPRPREKALINSLLSRICSLLGREQIHHTFAF